jgi:hypothetical protein
VVRNQAGWDMLPTSFVKFTWIEVRPDQNVWVRMKRIPENCVVSVHGTARRLTRARGYVNFPADPKRVDALTPADPK